MRAHGGFKSVTVALGKKGSFKRGKKAKKR
jgi:hypothetical protein